jgi:large subunit ribosomal protein L15
MKLNTLKPNQGSKHAKKRRGRGIGSGLGKTGGRGGKGQTARKSGGIPAGFEGGQTPLHRRLPKFGFTSLTARENAEVRLHELNKIDAEVIDIAVLKLANIIPYSIKRVKIINTGELTKAVTIKGIAVTAGARTVIENAGGKIVE